MTVMKAKKKINTMRGNEGKCTRRLEKTEQENSQNHSTR
jgi:hypothetical protein